MVTVYRKSRGTRYVRIGRWIVDVRWRSVNLRASIVLIPRSTIRTINQQEAARRFKDAA